MKIQSLMNLKGRRAIVTGATGGLGTVIAETLAELGSDLILVDLEKNEIESMQHRLADTFGVSVVGTVCDLENQDQRQDFIDTIVSDGRELNILVNNAAFVGSSNLPGWNAPFVEQSVEKSILWLPLNYVKELVRS